MKIRLLILSVGVSIYGCSADVSTATPPVAAAPAAPVEVEHPLKPEMVIVFTKGTIACVTRDDLQEIMEHGAKQEATKMQAMMVENGGPCLMLPPTKRVKIISVEYNNPDIPDLGIVEFVGGDTTSINGAWALSVGAETAPAVKPRHRRPTQG
jgi:hypothetical protein